MENVVVIKGPSAFGNSIMFYALKQTLATLGMIWRTVFIWPLTLGVLQCAYKFNYLVCFCLDKHFFNASVYHGHSSTHLPSPNRPGWLAHSLPSSPTDVGLLAASTIVHSPPNLLSVVTRCSNFGVGGWSREEILGAIVFLQH
jgi:hypothetical protein